MDSFSVLDFILGGDFILDTTSDSLKEADIIEFDIDNLPVSFERDGTGCTRGGYCVIA